MTTGELQHKLLTADASLIVWARKHSVTLLRVAIGLVYIWFGALKLSPGLSPAEPLIRGTYGFLPENLLGLFVTFIGVFEIVIGLLFMYGRLPRITIGLMLMQMAGAMSPIILAPHLMWAQFPHAFTLEGQYVFKDIILVSAALVIGAATMHRVVKTQVGIRTTAEIPVDNLR